MTGLALVDLLWYCKEGEGEEDAGGVGEEDGSVESMVPCCS